MDAVLILDTSGSMTEYNLRANKQILTYAKEAAQAFVNQAMSLNEDYRVGLGEFNDTSRQILGLTDQTGMTTIRNSIWGLTGGGQTNVAAGFELGARILRNEARPNARRMLLLFSDGVHNTGSKDPVAAGYEAQMGSNGIPTDIYTIGMVGALSEAERVQIRKVLDQPYAVRYIEIDGERDLEGVFYVFGAISGNAMQSHNILRITGCTEVELAKTSTGELLSSANRMFQASFGSLYVTQDGYDKIFMLENDSYSLRIAGGKTGGNLGINMEVLDGRGVVARDIKHYRMYGTPGTRLTVNLSFGDGGFTLHDSSFNPLDPNAIDPFTGRVHTADVEPANGFLTRGKSTVYSAPSGKSAKIGTVSQGIRYKDEFRVLWSDGNWYYIEYDLGVGSGPRNGVKRGYIERQNVEIVDGWVPVMFSLDNPAQIDYRVDLVSIPFNYGTKITVVRTMKESEWVTVINYWNAPNGYAYAYVQYGSSSSAERGYVAMDALR